MKEFSDELTIREVIALISRRVCLVCKKDLDTELGHHWHIPLCRKHRLVYLDGAK